MLDFLQQVFTAAQTTDGVGFRAAGKIFEKSIS